MSTIFHLVRHGANDLLSRAIAGRSPGLSLNEEGRQQASNIAVFLAERSIARIVSSPLERSRETAAPLAQTTGIEVEAWSEFIEVDFGDWTGRTFAELEPLEHWKKWNAHRSGNTIPNGESMTKVQARVVGGLEKLRAQGPGVSVAVFSHGDPIRAALVYYLGMPLDFILRLRIDPGSITTISLGDWATQLITLNQVPAGSKAG